MFRYSLAVLWAAWLILCTCTRHVRRFLQDFHIEFAFQPNPNWSELLIVTGFSDEPLFLIQKIGHFTGFFLLTVILRLRNPLMRTGAALFGIAMFAVFTEILQLYFRRDGRLEDMVIDTAGILLGWLLCVFVDGRRKRGVQKA